ncbi:MAG: hypothetical protein LBF12_07095 [Christensenellaceae bacterium]|jgi:hypothetical protein|nr:hypothetical protein [Christensenellaceae bacterium]
MIKTRIIFKKLTKLPSIFYIVILFATIFASCVYQLSVTKGMLVEYLPEIIDYGPEQLTPNLIQTIWTIGIIITVLFFLVVIEIIISIANTILKRTGIRTTGAKNFKNLARISVIASTGVMALVRLLYYVNPNIENFDGLFNLIVYSFFLFLGFLIAQHEFIYMGDIGRAFSRLADFYFFAHLAFSAISFLNVLNSDEGLPQLIYYIIGPALYLLFSLGGLLFTRKFVAKRFMQKQLDFIEHDIKITPVDDDDTPQPPTDIYKDFGF